MLILQADFFSNEIVQYAAVVTMIGGLVVPIVQLIKQRFPAIDSLLAIVITFSLSIVVSMVAWYLDWLPDGVTFKVAITVGIKAGIEASGIYGVAKGIGNSQHKVDDKRSGIPPHNPATHSEPVQPRPAMQTTGAVLTTGNFVNARMQPSAAFEPPPIDTTGLPPGARG